MALRQFWQRLTDERGQAELVSWLITQLPFWFMVTLVVVIAMVGVKQAGTASVAHLTARRAGTATLGAGQQVARQGGAVWRLPDHRADLQLEPHRRATTIRWTYTWHGQSLAARFRAPFRITVREHSRLEGFYDGPPSIWE